MISRVTLSHGIEVVDVIAMVVVVVTPAVVDVNESHSSRGGNLGPLIPVQTLSDESRRSQDLVE